MSEFTAPCVGGPCEGQLLPYDFIDGQAFPKEYLVANMPHTYCGKYVFLHSGHERRGTGDTWRWHPFMKGLEE